MKSKLVVLSVALVLIVLSCAQRSELLTFVIIPAEDAVVSEKQFAPLVEYLEDALDHEIELLLVSDYTAVVESMRRGDADFARFGPFDYVMATEEAEVEVIVAGIKKKTGKPNYTSMIVARSDRGITDLNGKTFAYVDVASASGYLIPSVYMQEAGVDLGKFFFAGSHSAVILAVKNGTVDAGAIADNRYYVELEKGTIEEGEFVILWESDFIPNSPVAVQKSMDETLKGKLLEALLEAPREIVEATEIGEIGFARMTDSDYDPVRRVYEATQ